MSQEPKSPSLWQSLTSVLAAFFGVQNSKNRERDFTRGKASHFIVIGIAVTVVLVLTVIFIVKLALRNAGL